MQNKNAAAITIVPTILEFWRLKIPGGSRAAKSQYNVVTNRRCQFLPSIQILTGAGSSGKTSQNAKLLIRLMRGRRGFAGS
jgi:hypothetical protein